MPYLLMFPSTCIELPAERETVLGRDESADVVLADPAVSRRHALVYFEDGCWHVEDLGSRNGVFVQGRRIQDATPLTPGAQLRLGVQYFTFHLGAPPAGGAGAIPNQETAALNPSPSGETAAAAMFAGQLTSVSLPELLQFLLFSRRTGLLTLTVDPVHARLELQAGELWSAMWGDLDGLEALWALSPVRQGRFAFEESPGSLTQRNIQMPTQQLLLEMCRLMDESTRQP